MRIKLKKKHKKESAKWLNRHLNDEYVLKSIEPPYINLQKIGPNRKLIVIAFTILGIAISVLLTLFQLIYRNNHINK